MNEMSKSDLKASASVRIAETQDGAVLLDIKQGLCFNINPVGTLIWKQVSEGRETHQIAQLLVELFNIPPEQAHRDVQEFLHDLKRKQLIYEPVSAIQVESRRGVFQTLHEFLPRLFRSRTAQNSE